MHKSSCLPSLSVIVIIVEFFLLASPKKKMKKGVAMTVWKGPLGTLPSPPQKKVGSMETACCAATSKRSRKPLCLEAQLLGPGSAPWSGLCHRYEGNKFARNMHVPFTFCSLVLKAESSLFEAHIWPKKGFQKQERRT